MGFTVKASAHHNEQEFLFMYSPATVLNGFGASTVNFQTSFGEVLLTRYKTFATALNYITEHHRKYMLYKATIPWSPNEMRFFYKFQSLSRQSITLQKPASWNFAKVVQSTELTVPKTDGLSEFPLLGQTAQFYFFSFWTGHGKPASVPALPPSNSTQFQKGELKLPLHHKNLSPKRNTAPSLHIFICYSRI